MVAKNYLTVSKSMSFSSAAKSPANVAVGLNVKRLFWSLLKGTTFKTPKPVITSKKAFSDWAELLRPHYCMRDTRQVASP